LGRAGGGLGLASGVVLGASTWGGLVMRYEVFNAVTGRVVAVTRYRWVAVVLASVWARWTGCWWYDWNVEGEGWL
jgi:hypothetical protein